MSTDRTDAVTFEGRQDLIAGLEPGQGLELVRQPENEFDANALAVHFGRLHIGFVKKAIAARIAPSATLAACTMASVVRPPPITGDPVMDESACHFTCMRPFLPMRTARTPSVHRPRR